MPEIGHKKLEKEFVIAVIVCLCFIIGSAFFVFHMMQENEKENIQYLNTEAKQNKNAIYKQIVSDFETLEGIAVCIGEYELQNHNELLSILKEINDNNSFVRMGFADTNGMVDLLDIGGETYTDINLADEAFFQKALNGQNALSVTVKDELKPGTYINYYGVPVKKGAGEIIGVLCAVNSASTFKSVIDTPIFNNSGYSCILDNQGKMVIRASRYGSNDSVPANLEKLGYLSEEQKPRINRALHSGSRLNFTFEAEGQEQMAVIEPIGVNGWFIFSTVSKSVLQSRYLQTALGISLIVVIAGAIFLILLFRQRSMMMKNQQMLMNLAYRDSLTGCRNFEKFILDGAEQLRTDKEGTYAIWYSDLKKFKYFNDYYGYNMGDKVLQWMASSIEKSVGENTIFCRSSADNFAGMLKYKDEKELVDWFHTLSSQFYQENNINTAGIHTEICVGFYCLKGREIEDMSIRDMVNRAIMAQKNAKLRPGSQYFFFDDTLREKSLKETEMEYQGKAAFLNQEFVPYFQPKVNIQDSNLIAGAEALVRWEHPVRGLIPPSEFIPLFEKNGMIVQLDRYMFEVVCQWYQGYMHRGGPPINMAVNVSRLDLFKEDFVDFYASVKQKYGIPDKIMELEFTESVILNDDEMFLNIVNRLQAEGFICSLDDFGAGYSSLNLLKNLPINVLKLDILFFRKSVDIKREHIVIANVINMAKQLEIKTIAEGVETPDQINFLREVGCDIVQGYVFEKPVSVEKFEQLLSEKQTGYTL